MGKSDRQRAMLTHLEENPRLNVDEAMAIFSASSATIRRDFSQLVAKGLAMRGPNEIRRLDVDMGIDRPLALREVAFSREKDAIGRQAALLLRDGDVVFIDGGTTTQSMVRHLPNLQLKIVTTCIRIADMLLERAKGNPGLEVFMPGGILSSRSYVLYGPQTIRHIESYRANWAFIGVDGIDEANLYSVNELIASTQTAMINNSDRTVLVTDHSKFGRRSMVCTLRLDERALVITDRHEETEVMLKRIESTGARVVAV